MLFFLLLAFLFHRFILSLFAPLSIRLWLWWHPRTVYGAKQARILTPLLAKAAGKPVLFTAQGLGIFARVCQDSQALGQVWLEGLLRAMLATLTERYRDLKGPEDLKAVLQFQLDNSQGDEDYMFMRP